MNFLEKISLILKYKDIPLVPKRLLRSGVNLSNRIFKSYPLKTKFDFSINPVFIVSAGRSGTTLLRSMLAAGGEIAIPAEAQIVHKLVERFPFFFDFGWEGVVRNVISSFEVHNNFPLWDLDLSPLYQELKNTPADHRSLAYIINLIYCAYATAHFPEAKIWGDKSPLHTYGLTKIRRVFPQAKYIHMLRDGRDVVSSMVKRHGDDFLYEGIHRWKTSIRYVNRFRKSLSPSNFLEIRYEKLVTDPQTELKKICEFLNINYFLKMLDFWKLPTTIEHKYYDHHANLDKPLFASSIGKWGSRLTKNQQKILLSHISSDLIRLGYKN